MNIFIFHTKVKVTFTLEQATKAQRGSRIIALLLLHLWWQTGGVGGHCHAPVALLREIGGWLGTGSVWTDAQNLAPTGIQSLDHATHRKLVSQLLYPSPPVYIKGSFTYLLTYLRTAWCRGLLEKLTSLQLVKKFPAFHGTRRFITALTSVRHLKGSLKLKFLNLSPKG